MRHLLFLRHGKADSPAGVGDFDRPLKNRGRRDAVRMGEWMRTEGLVPDLMIASSARRTLQTAERVMQGLGDDAIQVDTYRELYLAPAERIIGTSRQAPETAETVLVIGHNPGMAMAATEYARRFLEVPTCALSVFRIDGNWAELSPERAALIHHILPRGLTEAAD